MLRFWVFLKDILNRMLLTLKRDNCQTLQNIISYRYWSSCSVIILSKMFWLSEGVNPLGVPQDLCSSLPGHLLMHLIPL